jgi:glycosyltransferase involved in cell wall biosynthesis/SAM-dependent methyltransferase
MSASDTLAAAEASARQRVTRAGGRDTAASLPLVSGIVTAYNYERYLGEALESALSQDYPPDRLEVIVVDDGSTDRTPEIARRYAKESGGRIRYIRQDNAGLCAATTRGMQEARGDVITLLDADDVWVTSRTGLLVDALHRNPRAGLVYGDMEVIDAEGGTVASSWLRETGQIPFRGRVTSQLLRANFIIAPSLMVRADLRERFCPILPFFEDSDYYIAARVAEVAEIDFVPAVVARYRRHGANMSHGKSDPRKLGILWNRRLQGYRWILANLRADDLTVEDLVEAYGHFLGTYEWVSRLTGAALESLIEVSEVDRTQTARELAAGQSALAEPNFVAAASHFVAALSADPFNPDARAGLDNAQRRLVVPRPRRVASPRHERQARDYHIKPGYTRREAPAYFVDLIEERTGTSCQPDVYTRAAEVAVRLGATRIIDLGAGGGAKLAPLRSRFEVLGLDYGPNLELARRRFPAGIWREHDFDRAGALALSFEQLSGSVVICANVIEQLVHPEILLDNLREALAWVEALVISTPERDLASGPESMGPPEDPHRVREWNIGEFAALLEAWGFEHGDVGLTRSETASGLRHTILAVLYPDAERAGRMEAAGSSAT